MIDKLANQSPMNVVTPLNCSACPDLAALQFQDDLVIVIQVLFKCENIRSPFKFTGKQNGDFLFVMSQQS